MKNSIMKKTICLLLAFAVLGVSYVIPASASSLIRHYATDNGEVLLGGRYLEAGISKHGSFGAPVGSITAFHTDPGDDYADYIGLRLDEDGWDEGEAPLTGDYFTPGSPEERWMLGYCTGSCRRVFSVADMMEEEESRAWSTAPYVTDISDESADILAAEVNAETCDGVKIRIIYSFGYEDKQILTQVEIENNGTANISDVRFTRSMDPDQDARLYGTYNTYNKIICNPDPAAEGSADNFAMVVARGEETLSGFSYISFDSRARTSAIYFCAPSPFEKGLWNESTAGQPHCAEEGEIELTCEMLDCFNENGYLNEDSGIAITLREPSIPSGSALSVPFVFYSSFEPDVLQSVSEAKQAAFGQEVIDEPPHTDASPAMLSVNEEESVGFSLSEAGEESEPAPRMMMSLSPKAPAQEEESSSLQTKREPSGPFNAIEVLQRLLGNFFTRLFNGLFRKNK